MPSFDGPTQVLLVDDQPLFRRAIATLIAEQPDFVVVGQATNGAEAIEMARTLSPGLVVMDIEMPVMNGVEAVRILRETMPSIKVLMLTVSESDDYLFDAVRFGAHGYLLKDLQPEQLYEMMRAVVRGESPVSPLMAGRLLEQFRLKKTEIPAASAGPPPIAPAHGLTRHANGDGETFSDNPLASKAAEILTRRELETLQYVADGLSNKEIGVALSITEGTVKNHVHNALEKLQFENRIQAAAYVVRQGFAHRPESR